MPGAFPDHGALEAALDLAVRAPSAQNSQPWRWRVDGGGLHLYAEWGRALDDTAAARRDVMVSCGAVLDHCVLALAAIGWDAHVRRFPAPADSGHIALLELSERSPQAADRELVAAIGARRSDRRRYSPARPAPGTLELLNVRAARHGAEFGVVPRRRWTSGDGGDVTLDFGDAHRSAGEDPDGAVMIVLGTRTDDDPARVRAGEALSRVLLSATALGISSCTLTEPLHDTGNRLALACEVFDGERYPQTLIRIGRPAAGDEPAASPRRPAQESTVWERRAG